MVGAAGRFGRFAVAAEIEEDGGVGGEEGGGYEVPDEEVLGEAVEEEEGGVGGGVGGDEGVDGDGGRDGDGVGCQ